MICTGGVFKLELFLPEDYPMAPPKVPAFHQKSLRLFVALRRFYYTTISHSYLACNLKLHNQSSIVSYVRSHSRD